MFWLEKSCVWERERFGYWVVSGRKGPNTVIWFRMQLWIAGVKRTNGSNLNCMITAFQTTILGNQWFKALIRIISNLNRVKSNCTILITMLKRVFFSHGSNIYVIHFLVLFQFFSCFLFLFLCQILLYDYHYYLKFCPYCWISGALLCGLCNKWCHGKTCRSMFCCISKLAKFFIREWIAYPKNQPTNKLMMWYS